MRPFILTALTLSLASCSPGPSSPSASSAQASSVIPPSYDPGLKPAVPVTSAAMAEAASPSAHPPSAQCRAEIGDTAAQKLADRCRMVSPATHPPCNAANSCQMIQDEIHRSCALWDKDTSQPKPKECTA
jgi:hypothetical protein